MAQVFPKFFFLLAWLWLLLPVGGWSQTDAAALAPHDTLWVPYAQCYGLGDVSQFMLTETHESGKYLLSSELGFTWLLDEHYDVIAASPFQSIPNNERPYLPIESSALIDSTWVLLWETVQIVGTLPSTHAPDPCARKCALEHRGDTFLGSKHGISSSLGRENYLKAVAPETWWLYTSTRIGYGSKADFRDSAFAPIRICEITRRNNNWKFKLLPIETDKFPVSPTALQFRNWIGWSYLQPTQNGLWWTNTELPQLYLLDDEGHRIDSVELSANLNSQALSYVRDEGKNSMENAQAFLYLSENYGVFHVGNLGYCRLLWRGPAHEWVLLYRRDRASKVIEILLGPALLPHSLGEKYIYLCGTRIGDRIAFPYYSISKLVAEAGQ